MKSGNIQANLLKDFDLTTDVIKGVGAISGLFNLIPIQLSDINQVLKMDTAIGLRFKFDCYKLFKMTNNLRV